MSTLLLDASVILAAFDSDDEFHQPSQKVLTDPDVTLATLDLARYEVANVAVRAWREPACVAPLLEAIDRISADGGVIPSTAALLGRAAKVAEEQTISVYDAAYVAAAEQAGGALVSCDTRDLVGKGLASSPGAGRENYRSVANGNRGLLAGSRPAGKSMVDELLAERRREAESEGRE